MSKTDCEGSSLSVGGHSTASLSFSDMDQSRKTAKDVRLKFLPPNSEAQQFGITPCIIGWVHSPLKNLADCPHWQDKGPKATLEIRAEFIPALEGVKVGEELTLITWLHLSDRTLLSGCKHQVQGGQLRGVFNSRSPDRPNPIGLHNVTIIDVAIKNDKAEIQVNALEALDGTPILDIKRVCH